MHTIISSDSFNKPLKVYKDGSLALKVRTAGMPNIAAPTVTAGGAGANNYIYAFLYYYSYVVEGVTFEDFGKTVQVSLANSDAPNSTAVAISAIPVIANGGTDNYDTTQIKVKIYRTENNGTTLYYVGQVTNGTTTYSDTSSDTTIKNANILIYTTGGVVDNETPPPAKYVHVTNDICMYGNVQEAGINVPNRIRQSIKGDIDSCPSSFFDDMEDEITGISSVKEIFLIFCKRSIYRVEGFFDETGQGGMSHLKISSIVGCVSHNSIVQTVEGVFFAAEDGFYFCDGYNIQRISDEFNTTYKSLVNTTAKQKNIYGEIDRTQQKIWWACQSEAGNTDNDSVFVFDLRWGIKKDGAFTTMSNGSSFNPTAIKFFNNLMYRADKHGFIFIHDDSYYTDPKIDLTKSADLWATKTIIYDYRSCAFNFGTSFVRKFVPSMNITLENRTNASVQIYSINDDGTIQAPLSELRYRDILTWGDPDIIWGDNQYFWNKGKLLQKKRHMPAKYLRCDYKQIRITNSYTIITNSDTLGLATVDTTAKTATTSGVSQWPSDALDYFLSFLNDDYITQYLITERTSNTVLTYTDPSNASIPGSQKWELRGYKKGESIGIVSYEIHYKMLTPSQQDFRASQTGENA